MEDKRVNFQTAAGIPAKRYKQLISGNELKVYKPRNLTDGKINFGDTIEFAIDGGPFMISNNSVLRVEGQFQKRTKNAADGGYTDWTNLDAADYQHFLPVQNIGSGFFEEIRLLEGQNTLETNYRFIRNGRWLFENFVLSHMDGESKSAYTVKHDDPANFTFMTSKDYDAGVQKFAEKHFPFFFNFNVTPFAWPFQYRNRSTQEDKLFLNSGQQCVLQLKLVEHMENLYKLSNTAPPGTQFQISIYSIKLILSTPRVSEVGTEILSSSRMPRELGYPTDFIQQFGFATDNQPEVELSMDNVELPHYLLLQLYDNNVFLGNDNKARKKWVDKPLAMDLDRIDFSFGQKELNYNTANFNISKEESADFRQQILKTSDVFGAKKMDPRYQADMEGYLYPHFLFSFCSNEVTQERLKPQDATLPVSARQKLKILMYGRHRNGIGAGKIVVTLIYKKEGCFYLPSKGYFRDRYTKDATMS